MVVYELKGGKLMRALSTQEVQQKMLDLFREIESFLEHEDIPYVVTGGTALGAVRHGGFIPWDDDMDIAVNRKDYEFFIRHFKPKMNYFSLKSNLDCDWGYAYARVTDDRTIYDMPWVTVDNGVFVDVFPIDKLPDNSGVRNVLYLEMKTLDVFRNAARRTAFKPGEKGKIIKALLSTIAKVFGDAFFARQQDALARFVNRKNKNSNLSGLFVVQGINRQRETHRSSLYIETQKVLFEGTMVNVPGDVQSYLERLYGIDYMQLPELSDRKTHGTFYAKQ